jgi:hypothetical protein
MVGHAGIENFDVEFHGWVRQKMDVKNSNVSLDSSRWGESGH